MNNHCIIIKFTQIFLIIYMWGIAVTSYSQTTTLTLGVENGTILQVIKEIEKRSEYSFVYNMNEVELNKTVSVKMVNLPIVEILNSLFDGTSLGYKITNNHIALFRKDKQQQQTHSVEGIVKDEHDEPIVGANVVVKGTSNGIVTNLEGKFVLTIPENVLLQVSYIGFKTYEITVKRQTYLNIVLKEDMSALDEVVVVGYGTMKKSDLTGTVARADLTLLRESPNISIGEMLQGTVPGLNIGAVNNAGQDPSISIRGRSSISGSNSPLIVLDGIVYRGNLVDINPNDIESIDVLKDASAAAIYGSQASNGVILIASKIGTVISKPVIEYSGTFIVGELLILY